MINAKLRAAVLFSGVLSLHSVSSSAQYAWFSRPTDIISVSGQTDVQNELTIEAVFMLPTSSHSGGSIFNEWVLQQEEKSLGLSFTSINGVAFPNDLVEVDEKHGLISLGKWHHVAFVCNGHEERIYLDGVRIQSAPAADPIANAEGQAFIGYAPRGGSDYPSFVGFLDSLRVSKIARYSGLSFTPPTGDLSSDPDTILLYNFNDPPNSPTVKDESPLGRTGTLGTGFAGATAPKLISELPAEAPLGLEIFPAVELQFQSSQNVQYHLQSSPDMAVWSDMPDIIVGDGTQIHKLISTEGNGRLFYRVVARP